MSKKKGKKGNKGNKQEKPEKIELATCPNCDEEIPADATECPECGQKFADEDEASEEVIEDNPEEETEDEASKEVTDITKLPSEIKMTGLIIGIILSFSGVIGVIGLRTGFIQSLLGNSSPYPGIGTAEPIGHIVSIIPTILGLIMIMSWGIKNDPIYYKLEEINKDKSDDIEDDSEEKSDDVIEVESIEIESEDIEESALDDVVPQEFSEPIITPDTDDDLDDLGELEDVLGDITEEPVKGPSEVSQSVKDELAEQIRVERCERMLTTAVVLPDDKEKLRGLIATGISAIDFTEEVKKAIEKRKKREIEEDVTADEKAAILEDELVAELAGLEDELEDDMDEEDLEDQILKEIGDLEGL